MRRDEEKSGTGHCDAEEKKEQAVENECHMLPFIETLLIVVLR